MPGEKVAIGITSTVPIEVVYASGNVPVDLNNRFISSDSPRSLIEAAERAGLPAATCSWVKGLYATILGSQVRTVIGVVQGDCTHLQAMLEALLPEGVEFVPFAYPFDRNRYQLRYEIEKLMERFGVQWDAVKQTKRRLDEVRAFAHEVDRLTWESDAFSGQENLQALLNCSDFKGDPDAFQRELETTLATHPPRQRPRELRLGLLGVPGVYSDLFTFLEEHGARVVYNEVARQFAMPDYSEDLLEQYTAYRYPYSVFGRIEDIKAETEKRRLDGYLHYVQAFCHHQIEDLTLRKRLDLPLLTIEGDRPGTLDGRTRTRLEAFLDVLKRRGQTAR
jgi:benzoyl-CoA reductase/2-hydroxyglutaryl-CoA dehydratase subunit BcrC/BadD/HgdB